MSASWGCRSIFRLFSLLLVLLPVSCSRPGNESVSFRWFHLPSLPPAPGDTAAFGLAGPVAGVSNDTLLVAGGANFRDGLPWKGAIKVYYDDIYLLADCDSGSAWTHAAVRLPIRLAYSACVTTPDGIISIGGENASGPVPDVYRLALDDGAVTITRLPDIPAPTTSAGAALSGSRIYLVGGLTPGGATSAFYCLDPGHPGKGWKKLPDLPVAASHAVVLAADDPTGPCIWFFGGRYPDGAVTTFLSSVWKYRIESGQWMKSGGLTIDGNPDPLSAGTGLTLDNHRVALFGGDGGLIYNDLERLNTRIARAREPNAEKRLTALKDSIYENHPGFSRNIRIYNTLKGVCSRGGEMPVPGQVTTTAVRWGDRVIIPSGEKRPGIRTPMVKCAEINLSR
jgi:N-acetylneuraminate epimerase